MTISKDVVIIGGGTSLREGIQKDLWNKLKPFEVWSLNYAYLTMPYLPAKQFFIDRKFYMEQKQDLIDLHDKGVPIYCRYHKVIEDQQAPITMYQIEKTHPFTTKELQDTNTRYTTGLTLSGAFALSCAICWEYDRIFLLGYDFGTSSPTNKDTHYYQGKLKVNSQGMGNPSCYWEKNKLKEHIKQWDYFTDKHDNIYNVSLQSNLKCFPKISYDKFFEML